jgi:DNA polymerase IIIc chi subunit
MNIRELIIQDINTVLNNNPEGIQFVVGKPALTANSKFSIEVPRTPEQPWYVSNFEEYIPVAVNSLDGSYLPQQAFTALTLVGDISFLIPFDRQDNVLSTLFDVVEDFPGRVVSLDGYRVSYTIGVPKFIDLVIINDRKHIEYNIEISVIASKNAFTAHDIQVYLTLPDELEVELPLIAYAPVKTTDTVTIQTPDNNRATSFVKNTVWTASIAFFLTNGADEEEQEYDTTILSLEMLQLLESDTIEQNIVYGLRVKYPFGTYEETKQVVITNLQPNFTKDSIASMTIVVEEVYDEVI